MPTLLVVGGGLFGSQAAAYARSKGIDALVFDSGREGAASPAAAGLFCERWIGKKLQQHYHVALAVLEKLYGIRQVVLTHDDGAAESFLCVPPILILEPNPIRETVTAVGDGWLEAGNIRYEGWVYVAAGVWCEQLWPNLPVFGKAGSAFVFEGETAGRIRALGPGRQAIAFVRDAGTTHFSDGTAERDWSPACDIQSLGHAASLGLHEPIRRLWGRRPYMSGGPFFRKIGARSWLATGGRKMGTVLGASFAHRLVVEELE